MSKVAGVSVVEQHKAQVAGSVANGQALAETLVSTVKAQAGSLKQFLTGIADLTKEGRTAFRATLDVQLKAMAENVKAQGNTKEAKRAANSARVRLSECRQFSVACDRGFYMGSVSPDNGYHAILTLARAFRDSTASQGPTTKKGRKPMTWVEKLEAYCTKQLALNGEQLEEASVMLRKMAKQFK